MPEPQMIRVFDQFGRQVEIPREEWRTKVLPDQLKRVWDDPDALYGAIAAGLEDGFHAEVAGAAKQLFSIDPIKERGACIYGIVLAKLDRLDDAEAVFRSFIASHGETGIILTNLAKVQASKKQDGAAEATLWRALELDPNQDNALGWYVAWMSERGGPAKGAEALRRVASLPRSWRAQVWLGRDSLEDGDAPAALQLFRAGLAAAGKPAPGDVLAHISGCLGQKGKLRELIELVAPEFSADLHGLQVGNNLIKAHLDLGEVDEARAILEALYRLKRPDWAETLNFWDGELAKAGLEKDREPAEIQVSFGSIEGPVWAKPGTPPASLTPPKAPDTPVIALLGSCAAMAEAQELGRRQLADAPGRLSRALPLFLAEQIELSSPARALTLIPWMADKGGFILAGQPWPDEQAIGCARSCRNDYLITVFVEARDHAWKARARLIKTATAQVLGEVEAPFPPGSPRVGAQGLAEKTLGLLASSAGIALGRPPAFYVLPENDRLDDYLLRVEQLLAVRFAGLDSTPAHFLNGEREILDGNLKLCLACPTSAPARLLLAQTLAAMKRPRPDVLGEFKDKVNLLEERHPLPEPVSAVVRKLLAEALA
jgi:tetratricopeptide (TPR) repeat protein